MSRKDREEVYEFILEQLKRGYIWTSKLSQITPMFFVGKKNGKKQIIKDYRYLNKWTVKDNYPLPLISDIVENISTKKYLKR